MNDPLASLAVEILTEYPWMVWTFLTGTLTSIFFRAAYPEPSDRPRWMVGLLAVCDVLAVNPGSLISSVRRATK